MVLQSENLQLDTGTQGPRPLRIEPAKHGGAQSRRFAKVTTAATLAVGTPVAWNEALDAMVPWNPNTGASGAANEVQSIATTGTPTGGTFTLTLNGETTTAIAFNASAATIIAAIIALPGVDPAAVVGGGGALPTAVTVTFSGAQFASSQVPLMFADGSLLTGGTTPTVAVTETTEGTQGTAAPAGTIIAFVHPNPIDLLVAGEVFGVVMMKGLIHHDDIVLPTVGAPTQAQLDAALRDGLLARGILVEHLAGVH